MTSNGPRTLCDGPEAPTQRKSGSLTDYGMTDLLTGVTARDAYIITHLKMVFQSKPVLRSQHFSISWTKDIDQIPHDPQSIFFGQVCYDTQNCLSFEIAIVRGYGGVNNWWCWQKAKKGGSGGRISGFTAPPWVSRISTEEDLTYLATERPPPMYFHMKSTCNEQKLHCKISVYSTKSEHYKIFLDNHNPQES